MSDITGPHLDRAIRERDAARAELVLLDIERPPICRAHVGANSKREGVAEAARRFRDSCEPGESLNTIRG